MPGVSFPWLPANGSGSGHLPWALASMAVHIDWVGFEGSVEIHFYGLYKDYRLYIPLKSRIIYKYTPVEPREGSQSNPIRLIGDH